MLMSICLSGLFDRQNVSLEKKRCFTNKEGFFSFFLSTRFISKGLHRHTKSGYHRLNEPVEKGGAKAGVTPHLHTCTLRKADTSKLLCVGELREASESAAASCSELKIPG